MPYDFEVTAEISLHRRMQSCHDEQSPNIDDFLTIEPKFCCRDAPNGGQRNNLSEVLIPCEMLCPLVNAWIVKRRDGLGYGVEGFGFV